MNSKMIIQVPAFNKEYFKVGDAYKIIKNKDKKEEFNALFLSFDTNRLCFIVVRYDNSSMCGTHGYVPDKLYVSLEAVVGGEVDIIELV